MMTETIFVVEAVVLSSVERTGGLLLTGKRNGEMVAFSS